MNSGHLGQGHIGATTVKMGPAALRFPAVQLPDIRPEPEVSASSARFVQTVGGRMGLPTPRPVPHKPFVQFWPSIAWTTLALTINADGSASHELVGASPFPRHWIYDHDGTLVEKSAVIDFAKWFHDSYGDRTPWGEQDSETIVAAVESALERSLSSAIMSGGTKPKFRKIKEGEDLVRQGQGGTDVYLILDGIFVVEVDGEEVAEIGLGSRGRARSAPERHPDGNPVGRTQGASPACPMTPSTRTRLAASPRRTPRGVALRTSGRDPIRRGVRRPGSRVNAMTAPVAVRPSMIAIVSLTAG